MKQFILTIALLVAVLPTWGQQLPERSAVRKGNRHYNKGRYERSIERYNEALEAVPGQWEATYDLGNALYRAERYEAAEKSMQQAAADSLRSDGERAHAFYNLGNAQFKQKKYQEALQSYKHALLLNPADEEAKYNYAYTKKLLDDQEQQGGGQDNQNQDQNQDKNQNQDQNQQQQQGQNDQSQQQNQNDQQQQKPENEQEQPSEPNEPQEGEGQPQQPEEGISEQEQEQILDAIQAQEDRTQEKLKEQQGVVIRGSKNW